MVAMLTGMVARPASADDDARRALCAAAEGRYFPATITQEARCIVSGEPFVVTVGEPRTERSAPSPIGDPVVETTFGAPIRINNPRANQGVYERTIIMVTPQATQITATSVQDSRLNRPETTYSFLSNNQFADNPDVRQVLAGFNPSDVTALDPKVGDQSS